MGRLTCQNPECPMSGYCDGYCVEFFGSVEPVYLGSMIYLDDEITKEDAQAIKDFWNAPWVNGDGTTTPKEGNTWVLAHRELITKSERDILNGNP